MSPAGPVLPEQVTPPPLLELVCPVDVDVDVEPDADELCASVPVDAATERPVDAEAPPPVPVAPSSSEHAKRNTTPEKRTQRMADVLTPGAPPREA
jgi:hypothetical protein